MSKIDWVMFIYDPTKERAAKLDRISERVFWDENLAMEATEQILKEWDASNWEKLNKYAGDPNNDASKEAYLVVVFRNAVRDKYRRRYSRCTPPLWVKNLGGIWLQAFKQLCCANRDIDEISQRLANHQHSVDDLREFCLQIKARVKNCGQKVSEVSLDILRPPDADGAVQPIEPAGSDLESQLADEQKNLFLALIYHIAGVPIDKLEPIIGDNSDVFNKLLAQLPEFDDIDIILIKHIFVEGKSRELAAKMLGLKYHQVTYRIEKILKKLQSWGGDLFG